MFALPSCGPEQRLIGDSPAIRQIRDQLQRAALTDVPVLITGENGTGKDLAARLLHEASRRRTQAFMKLNCPSMTDRPFSGEACLKGQSLMNAFAEYTLRFCLNAEQGTLFLDEIGDLDAALQPKLLCALQDCQDDPLGAGTERSLDIRLICATNRDLELEISRGLFRSDLFHRINVVRIQMPALRDRVSDIPMLMSHFTALYALQYGRQANALSSSFLRKLVEYDWPGNVRELENMAKRYVLFGGEEQVLSGIAQSSEFRPSLAITIDLTTPLRVQTKRARQHLEKSIILGVLEAHRWNRRKTARSLDISYRALLYKIKEVGLPRTPSSMPAVPRLSAGLPGNSHAPDDPG